MNARLYVSLNGVGTACYDPLPAVAEFLRTDDKLQRETETTMYKQRFFFHFAVLQKDRRIVKLISPMPDDIACWAFSLILAGLSAKN